MYVLKLPGYSERRYLNAVRDDLEDRGVNEVEEVD